MFPREMADHVDRRDVLKGIASLTSGGLLAGCTSGGGNNNSGGDTDDQQTSSQLLKQYTFATPDTSTTAYAMGTGMSSIISQKSEISMHIKPTAGSGQAMIQMLNGAVELSNGADFAGLDALNHKGQFSNATIQQQLTAFHSFYWLYFGFLVPTDTEFKYVSDLAGEPVTIGPTGPSFFQYVKNALQVAIPESKLNLKYVGFSQWGSAMSSGKVVMVPFLNTAGITPSYVQQTLAQNEVRMLGWKKETIQKIRDSKRLSGVFYGNDNPEYDKVSEFTTNNDTFQISVKYLWYASDLMNAETIHRLLTVLYKNREQLPRTHAALTLWSDIEFWPSHFRKEIPVHPGAKQFYTEHGVWNDKWRVADF